MTRDEINHLPGYKKKENQNKGRTLEMEYRQEGVLQSRLQRASCLCSVSPWGLGPLSHWPLL